MKRNLFLMFFFLFIAATAYGQTQTAIEFFNTVSGTYASVQQYSAQLEIQQDETRMAGVIYVVPPREQLFIEFSQPSEQVLMVNDGWLNIYIPRLSVYNRQVLPKNSDSAVGLASPQGLKLMSNSYSVSYYQTYEKVPLSEDESEKVVKLRLSWKSQKEAFQQIILSITDRNVIRRIEAVSARGKTVTLTFRNVRMNSSAIIPENLFEYVEPRKAYTNNDFLFSGDYQIGDDQEEGTEE